MEPRAHHILIGLFTLASAAALMVFVLWLGQASGGGEKVPYDIVFEDVKGLTQGSSVLYSGISVGQVVNLRLDRQDPSKVWTRIQVNENTPILTTTTARMALANITGAYEVLLETEDPSSPPLEAKGRKVPVIPSKPSPFNQLRTSGEELLVNVTRLVENASGIFSAENNDNVSQILENLEQTSGAFAGRKGEISQGIDDLAAASGELRSAVTQTSQLLGQFNSQFEQHGSQMLLQAEQSLTSLGQLSGNLSQLVENNQEALTQSIHGMAEIGPILSQLDELVRNLNNITRQLEEDPSGYILGGEKIREYKP